MCPTNMEVPAIGCSNRWLDRNSAKCLSTFHGGGKEKAQMISKTKLPSGDRKWYGDTSPLPVLTPVVDGPIMYGFTRGRGETGVYYKVPMDTVVRGIFQIDSVVNILYYTTTK